MVARGRCIFMAIGYESYTASSYLPGITINARSSYQVSRGLAKKRFHPLVPGTRVGITNPETRDRQN